MKLIFSNSTAVLLLIKCQQTVHSSQHVNCSNINELFNVISNFNPELHSPTVQNTLAILLHATDQLIQTDGTGVISVPHNAKCNNN